MKRTVLIIILVILVAVVAFGIYQYRRLFFAPLPAEQTLTLQAVEQRVEISRDAYGTPHIVAQNSKDLFYGIGYAQAQDRLFQMDLNRRIGTGRLAELFGDKALSLDRFMHTIGLPELAQETPDFAAPELPDLVDAYVQGINDYLRQAVAEDKLPLEYRLLGVQPELWRPEDSWATGCYLAWALAYNYSSELIMAQVAEKVSPQRLTDLLPHYPPDKPVHIDRAMMAAAAETGRRLKHLFALVPALAGASGGSNAWAVAGNRSASGKPLLAADPHLQAGRIPGVFYAMHLSAPQVEEFGVAMPGQPFILIGRNAHLAWGVTNNGADVQDLFVFQRHPKRRNEYHYNQQWLPLEKTLKTIKVKDEESASGFRNDTLIVYRTLRGPVISDMAKDSVLVSLHWLGEESPLDFSVFWLFTKARNWQEFRRAAMAYNGSPQNLVYADREGHIAYRVMGSIPERNPRVEWNSFLPVDGGNPDFQWVGMRPAEEMPELVDPPEGLIASANQPTYRADDPRYFPQKNDPGFRVARIRQLLTKQEKHDLNSFARIQSDSYSLLAERLMSRWSEELEQIPALSNKDMIAVLRKGPQDDQAMHLYHLLRRRFAFNTLRDELGDSLAAAYLDDWYLSLSPWLDIIDQKKPWLDDVTTPEKEDYSDILSKSWREVTDYLSRTGTGLSWQKAHRVPYRHPFSKVSRILAYFLDHPAQPMAGDGETINRAGFDYTPQTGADFDVSFVAAFRQVVDLAHPEHALGVLQTGSSGQPGSAHYDDQIDLWLQGKYISWDLTDK
ncbi:MAG TPA: penicillin acylase family protein [Caldithrix abyssi]|uniref:Penicillin acylase family protein n=1 Tax=Caldithrix abyssi TaxID=187145 RepID=A0A7V5PQK5_CALAY|nr:penicillin acylase family protein [Caldithrix abyssi]